jgi:DNA-binding response OmpR family regulator
VLLVDDEPHFDLLLRPHLERRGYRVTLARTLAQARVTTTADAVDVVLLNVSLPDGSGLDWLRELRAHPRTQRLPVLVLTGEGEGEELLLQGAAGLSATVRRKPFSPSKLTNRIASRLGETQGPDAA